MGSHWERVILHNEIMTSSSIKDGAYSKFTMSLLEDSGWYAPIYNKAEDFFWGKDSGCDLVTKPCFESGYRGFCKKG